LISIVGPPKKQGDWEANAGKELKYLGLLGQKKTRILNWCHLINHETIAMN
jgi:hypothetical protein